MKEREGEREIGTMRQRGMENETKGEKGERE